LVLCPPQLAADHGSGDVPEAELREIFAKYDADGTGESGGDASRRAWVSGVQCAVCSGRWAASRKL
jgi:hypothetical protein